MQGLKLKQNFESQTLSIIETTSGSIIKTLRITELGAFYHWLKFYEAPVDYILVPFAEAYCEIIYILKPKALMIISKEELYKFLRCFLGADSIDFMEEAAATFERSDGEKGSCDLGDFLARFYEANSKEEALRIYNQWQELIPLNNEALYRILEVMEYYLDEILNYFTLEAVLI